MDNSCERDYFMENAKLLKKITFVKKKIHRSDWVRESEKTTYQEEHVPLSGPRNWDTDLHTLLNTYARIVPCCHH